ncbi:hypothetical protein RRG08_055558 [Elysia crispata]|uniref:Uncharacterized protein n=1 Tax=Elysia crispata TaxID=231223 RepID=A0AAE1DY17_9GAST|nr:hypothetical protein RRG08_055558 [Elysia crispata]
MTFRFDVITQSQRARSDRFDLEYDKRFLRSDPEKLNTSTRFTPQYDKRFLRSDPEKLNTSTRFTPQYDKRFHKLKLNNRLQLFDLQPSLTSPKP